LHLDSLIGARLFVEQIASLRSFASLKMKPRWKLMQNMPKACYCKPSKPSGTRRHVIAWLADVR
jgi:hypothetical protein